MTAPQNSVYRNGYGNLSGDELNTFLQGVILIADLRDFSGTAGMTVFVQGQTAIGDGGQGPMFWSDDATGPDDNFNVILPYGDAEGGWIRLGNFAPGPVFPCNATVSGSQITLVPVVPVTPPPIPFTAPLLISFVAPSSVLGPFVISFFGQTAPLFDGPNGVNQTISLTQYQFCWLGYNQSINGGAGGWVLINAVSTSSGLVPTGAMFPYTGPIAPSGYVFPYGQLLSRTGATAALFAVQGVTYGAGDGSTTFNTIDMRGRTSFCLDNLGGTPANRLTGAASGGIDGSAAGNTGGEQAHSQTVAELPSENPITGLTNNFLIQNDESPYTGTTGGTVNFSGSNLTWTGGGSAFNVINPGVVTPWILKL